jgi:hypothetical protein
MAVEPLDLGKELHVEREAIEHANCIVRIGGSDDPVTRVDDRL